MYVILCSALLLLCTYANNIIQGSENSKYLQLIMAHVNANIHTYINTLCTFMQTYKYAARL